MRNLELLEKHAKGICLYQISVIGGIPVIAVSITNNFSRLTTKLAAAEIPSQIISPPLGRRPKVLSTAVCEIFDIIPMQQNLVFNGQRGDLHSRVTNCFHICLSPPSPPFPRVAKFVFKSLLHLPRCNQQPNLNIPSV